MSTRALFAAIGAAALLAGAGLWLAMRPPGAPAGLPAPQIAPAAIFAATFRDAAGAPRSLGQFQGRLMVVNFWATWCAPCREEMPAFVRLQERWAGGGVQFVGLSGEEPEPVARFGRELGINYPLWTGGEAVGELSRRLGNRQGVLPHTAILDPGGNLIEMKIGPYSESELEAVLSRFARIASK